MTRYVLGFVFDESMQWVWLLKKARPDWQAGKLNGIGGHVEPGEKPKVAMAREALEETGLPIGAARWEWILEMRQPIGDSAFVCDVFRCRLSHRTFNTLTARTDEPLRLCDPDCLPENCLTNVPWLVMLCRDLNDGAGRYQIAGMVGA